MPQDPSDFKEITRLTTHQLSQDSWEKMRSVAFSSAGVGSAILLFVLQSEELRRDAALSVLFSCISIPLLLASAFMTESFITHGERSYKNLEKVGPFWLMSGLFYLGGAALIGAMFLLIHNFFPFPAYVFLGLCIAAVPAVGWHFNAAKPGA